MRTRHAIFATILVALLGGCSSSGGDGDGQPTEQRPAQPAQVSLELVPDKIFRIGWEASQGARFYRVLENPDGVSGFTPISGDLNASTRRFDHRVALYFRVNARYIVQACNDSGCADSAEQVVSGTLERAIGYFKASNTDGGDTVVENTAGDEFGKSVSLSADGMTLAVGAPNEDSAATGVNGDQDDNSARNAGAVYVFARIDGAWRQEAYLKASNTGGDFLGDLFGDALSLSADGATLAIGASQEDSAATGTDGDQSDESARDSGAVYVFARSDGDWQQQAYLKASNTGQGDGFGAAVSLSMDGRTLAVGAPFEDGSATGVDGDQTLTDSSGSGSGALYVFVRGDESWRQQAYVKAGNTDRSSGGFGSGVSLSTVGDTLAVAALGTVNIFVRSDGTWQLQADLTANLAGAGDVHRRDISLSADGDTLAVAGFAEGSGTVHLFERSSGNWQPQGFLESGDTVRPFSFADSISLSADGNTLAVGAPYESSAATGIDGDQNDDSARRSGAAYVFVRDGGTWRQRAYVKASNTDGPDLLINFEGGTVERDMLFGTAVSLSANSATLAVGSVGEHSGTTGINGDQDDDSEPQSGAVYLY